MKKCATPRYGMSSEKVVGMDKEREALACIGYNRSAIIYTDVYALKTFFDLADNLIGAEEHSSQRFGNISDIVSQVFFAVVVCQYSPFCALCERYSLLKRHTDGQ